MKSTMNNIPSKSHFAQGNVHVIEYVQREEEVMSNEYDDVRRRKWKEDGRQKAEGCTIIAYLITLCDNVSLFYFVSLKHLLFCLIKS